MYPRRNGFLYALFGIGLIKRQVQRQDVNRWLAEEPESALLNARSYQLAHAIFRQATRFRNAGNLKIGCFR